MSGIILASQSPRRKELLSCIIDDFEIIRSEIDEEVFLKGKIEAGVQDVALAKALKFAKDYPDAVIIGADTIVALDDHVLGKPKDEKDAFGMLRLLSGRKHQVMTGLALVSGSRKATAVEVTSVFFSDISEEQIEAYVRTGEPMDKAGAYGIQGRASIFVEKIEGCYFNVVGLPLFLLGRMLESFGRKAWVEW